MSAIQTPERTGRPIELAEEADFSLGKLRVRPSSREVCAADKIETIEPRVMQVLVALARRRGEVVSRDQLIELCWSGRLVSEDALNRSMTKVRKLSGPDTFTLETIPRIGYRLVSADPLAPTPAPPVGIPSSTVPEVTARIPRRRRRLRWWIGGALVFLLMIVFTGIGLYRQLSQPYFAVLPFDVIGSGARTAELAATIQTSIASQLSAQGYALVPVTVTSSYRGERKSAASRELDAHYIIDGSVHVDRGRLRVSARIDAGRTSVWSQEFDIDVAESAEAPRHIATTISGLFNPGVQMLFQNPPHMTAAVMRVGARMRQGDDMGAYVATRELVRKEPANRLYAVYHAIAVGSVLDLLPEHERAGALQSGRQAADFVGEDVRTGAPMSLFAVSPPVAWADRERLLREGLNKPFSDASGLRRLLANHLANGGRLAEALTVSEQALSIDRSSSGNVTANAYVLDTMGRLQEADAALARAERLWPGLEFVERGRFSVALARGDAAAARALLADPVAGPVLDPPAELRPLPAIVRALETRTLEDIERVEAQCADPAKIGRERARFCLHALVLLDRIDTFFALAPLYFPELRGASAQERDERWLAAPRTLANVRVLFRSDTSKVRADERFIAIVERLGLLAYWRETGQWPDFCTSEPASVCESLRGMTIAAE